MTSHTLKSPAPAHGHLPYGLSPDDVSDGVFGGQWGVERGRDRLGNWTYQFAVVVADMRHGIDLVIRGEDLLDSTGRQLLLARMLGRPVPPRFFHHRLILKPSGEKLSKAARDASVRERRAAGAMPGALIGEALAAVGLLPAPRDIPLEEAIGMIAC